MTAARDRKLLGTIEKKLAIIITIPIYSIDAAAGTIAQAAP
jgi:hypothetical protein